MSEGSFWPQTWKEAIPLLVWGVLIFAFGFEGVSSLIHGEWWQALFGFGGMVGLTAMLINWTRLQKLTDARWLVAAAIAALIVVAFSPYVEQRRWPFLSPENPSSIGKIAWNFEAAARGGGWFLGMFKTNKQEIRILGFQAHGRNVSKDSIRQLTGWMRSDITNITKPIYIMGQDNDESDIPACALHVPTTYDETYGIPALADFDVVTYPFVGFTQTDGISAATFLDTFAPFTVHIEYDGTTAERRYSKEEIQKQIDLFGEVLSLKSIPRVIRKETAAKPQLRALRPLTNATPVPGLPQLKPITPEDQFEPSATGNMIQKAK